MDADLIIKKKKIDYKKILDDYTNTIGDKVEYFEYKSDALFALIEPTSAISTDIGVFYYEKDKKDISYLSNLEENDYNEKNNKGMVIDLVGLDDKKYNEYIDKINANYGDYIIYNTVVKSEPIGEVEYTNEYGSAFNTNEIKLSLLKTKESYLENTKTTYYDLIDDGEVNGNFVLTDKILDGFRDFNKKCTMFVNMDTYNKIEEKISKETSEVTEGEQNIYGEVIENRQNVRVRCENVISFSDYINDFVKKYNYEILPIIYSLEYQEKMVYLDILQLILKIVIVTIMIIGIISAINIISASLFERREEFRLLSRLGATNGNISKILIYECVYMFVKALFISIILAIPVIYAIIKHMEKVITLKKLLIPFGSIGIFIVLLFIISLVITLYTGRLVKKN